MCYAVDLPLPCYCRGQLPRSHYHGRPLCMDQYTRIFSSCRIPGPRRDSVINYGLSISEPRHITVAHNNQFFKLDVYHYNGCPLTQGQIYTQLEKIWNSSIKTIKEPVGILTADHRNRWGVGRRILMKDWLNRESIEEIQQSIFAICLDAPMPHGHDECSSMAAQILHGGGSHSNTGNRWFDKTLQFIVGEDGTCGLLYERALAEGMPIMRISDYAMQFCKYPERAVSHGIPLPMPKKLHLNISSEVQYLIETSKIYLDIQVNDLDICCFEFSRFGKNFAKWYRLSPDGFIQMALQLAFYRLHGHVCASSETATTWMFHLGRTDEIRVTMEHTVRFVCSFDDVNTTDAEKLDLMKKAIAAHKENTNQAVIGQGIDRHLFGLKMQAIESGFRVPEIFMDTAYAISTHFRLATNQVQYKHIFVCPPVSFML
uniref:Carnitine O-acetyltransferase b n=1 Tax=Eptatretus burgeri TaxID=7764 RepID=A0A8C4QV81_EPTBU